MKMILLNLLFAFASLITMPSTIFSSHFAVQNTASMKYCLVLEANITGTLEYQNMYLNKTTTVHFTVPEKGLGFVEVNQDGSVCAEKEEKLQLDFVPDGLHPEVSLFETQKKWSILLEFEKEDQDSNEFFILANYSLIVHYYPSMNSTYTNDIIPYVYPMQDGYQAEWGANTATHNGFVCSQNDLPLNLIEASIQFTKLKVVAFVDQNHPEFNLNQAFEQCMKDILTANLVPIISICIAILITVYIVFPTTFHKVFFTIGYTIFGVIFFTFYIIILCIITFISNYVYDLRLNRQPNPDPPYPQRHVPTIGELAMDSINNESHPKL